MNKVLKIAKNPYILFVYLNKIFNFKNISDKKYISLIYRAIFNKKINLDKPTTFNEKLQYLKLNDRKEYYSNMVDKYEAKNYVANIIGEEYIIPTIGLYDNFEEIDFDSLPNQFVIKCTHDSGSIVICKNKKIFDIKKARKKINKALKNNYYYVSREWPYKNVKPRIIIEKYMKNESDDVLKDYKFMCFNGKVKCSFVCSDRGRKDGLKIDFYDLDWKKCLLNVIIRILIMKFLNQKIMKK